MPSAEVEAVRRANEAFRAGDLDAVLREAHPHIVVADPERAGASLRGHDRFRAWISDWLESWETYGLDVEAIVEAGESVVVLGRHWGRARGSGIDVDARGAFVYRFEDGKIASYRPYTRRADALEAAGLAGGAAWAQALETIVAGYEAWNRGDIDVLAGLLDPDVEFRPIEESVMPAFRGREGMRDFAASSAEAWAEFTFTPAAFTVVADQVLVELDVTGKARASGIVVNESWAHVFVIREGRIVKFRAFRSSDEARESLAYSDRP